jgi:hypothetical protein
LRISRRTVGALCSLITTAAANAALRRWRPHVRIVSGEPPPSFQGWKFYVLANRFGSPQSTLTESMAEHSIDPASAVLQGSIAYFLQQLHNLAPPGSYFCDVLVDVLKFTSQRFDRRRAR